MPHATPLPHATLLLVVAATMVIARRALRSQPSAPGGDGPRLGVAGAIKPHAGGPAAGDANDVVRTLAERGLLGSEHLASMSPAEREFFLKTVGPKLGDGGKPRLMTQTHATGAPAGTAATSGPVVGAATAAAIALDPADETVPHAALVSGSIHCPVCRTPLGKRADAPLLMSRCPGCSRRVAAHVDGDRLTVTLHYTLRTPAMGVPVIKISG